MSLIVETGAGVAGANAYISVVDATAYFAARGIAAWAALASDTVREQLIIKATDYMEQAYRLRWKGYRVSASQVLSWPRGDVDLADTPYDTLVAMTVVPDAVKNACAELALRAATQTLAPDLARGKERVTIGPITTVYDKTDPQTKRFPAIDMLLRPYMAGSSSNLRVIAA